MAEPKTPLWEGIRNSAVVKNPVLFEAVGVASVVAMATSVKSAIILATISALELLVTEVFACLLLRHLKSRFRMPIYAVLGLLVNIPCFMFFEHFTPNEANNAGIFLPLLAVNSLIALHCERFAVKHTLRETLVDAVSAGAGYAFVSLVVGALREILGSGTIYSVSLHIPVRLQGLLLPFGGFLLLGFFAAAVNAHIRKKYPDEHPETAFDMREISQSHIGSIQSLFREDFDPYAEEAQTDAAPSAQFPLRKKEKPKKSPAKKRAVPKADDASAEAENAAAEAAPTRSAREMRSDYLLDFDEMLSELEMYKQKQAEAVEDPPQTQAPAVQTAESESAAEAPAAENASGEEEADI